MYKFLVCALFAVAAASPEIYLRSPWAYSSGLAPAVTYTANRFLSPAPLVYRTPYSAGTPFGYAHLIKKRSLAVPFSSYIPTYTTYSAPLTSYAPLATTYSYNAPVFHSTPVIATHLIKKRSAPLIVPASRISYVAPASYGAVTAFPSAYTTYAASHIVPTNYFSAGPWAYTQFIKK